METIGIICEFNPFHNGHVYFLKKVKELYPDKVLVCALNGYFLERGEVSILPKDQKVKFALEYGIDIVLEIPYLYGTQSADSFAHAALTILNSLGVSHLVFGSESCNLPYLEKMAQKQLEADFKIGVSKNQNYPARLNEGLQETKIIPPNDLLGISYIKTILKEKLSITYSLIQRTNDYHDNTLDSSLVSASNIREKLKKKMDIHKYVPQNIPEVLVSIHEELLFSLLRYRILTDHHLDEYLDVTEGLDNKLRKVINEVSNLQELTIKVKSKRYTYNRIKRMFNHILIGVLKKDAQAPIQSITILGFSKKGQAYLNEAKKTFLLPTKKVKNDIIQEYEKKASLLYQFITYQNKEDETKEISLKDSSQK